VIGVRFSTSLLAGLVRRAAASPGREICGLLLGRAGEVLSTQAAANVAPNPACAFEIDPAVLLVAHRAARLGRGLPVLGWYHSHPTGSAIPSARDAAAAALDGRLWLILTATEARLWRAVPGGTFLGCFVEEQLVDPAS
jgi:desampylase